MRYTITIRAEGASMNAYQKTREVLAQKGWILQQEDRKGGPFGLLEATGKSPKRGCLYIIQAQNPQLPVHPVVEGHEIAGIRFLQGGRVEVIGNLPSSPARCFSSD